MHQRDLTFRVFVSSTFSDLVAERNAFQEHVFPRLREFCQKRGARFQAIDLRWGVSEEAGQDQSTMRICRAEIARCQSVTPRPNFLVLLGDRHGWRPLPDEIPAAEFESLRPHLPADLAIRWYRLDENAVCALPGSKELDKGAYVLQPRTGEFKNHSHWSDMVERPLGDAFRRAARAVGLPERDRIKYEASATAQEIHDGAFAQPEASEHVVAFIRELRTADGRPLREALPRDTALKAFLDLKKDTPELDREAQDQLDALKERLGDRLGPERVKTYTARWEGGGSSTEHVPRLCLDAYRSLRRLIHAQIQRHSTLSPLEEERQVHQEFARRRARDFTGQAGPLAEVDRYLSPTSEPTAPLVVHGASGSGKSALLAKAVAGHQARYADHQLVFRFIGATANSTDLRSLLEGLCRELGERYGADNTDLPLDLDKLTVIFRQRLELATAAHPLALFLDALDQLQVADRPELFWLPDKLPPHVQVVVSAIPGPILDSLRSHLSSARLLELGPMRPEDGEELLQKWLRRAGRRLIPQEQRQAIRDGFARRGLPLYLRLAFEEAQRWRSYDHPPPLSPDVDGLIECLFHQLSENLHHEPLLVERAISYLRCSRYGLTEDELLDLLTNDPEYWDRFLATARHALPVTDGQQTRRLPIVIWSRLYHDLEPYLSWRSADGTALMVFFHTRFNEVADRQFLHDESLRHGRHAALARYFVACAKGRDSARKWATMSVRGLAHCVFHLTKARDHEQAGVLLSDFGFLMQKLRAGLLESAFEDYDIFRRETPAQVAKRFEIWADFFRDKAHILQRGQEQWPAHKILLQLAIEHADDSPLTIGAEQWLAEDHCDWLWLRRVPRMTHAKRNPCLGVLEGHRHNVDGAFELRDGHLLSWSMDWTLRLWDSWRNMCLATLKGHTNMVLGALELSDRRLVSWAGNNVIQVGEPDCRLIMWDTQTGTQIATLEGHTDMVNGVLELDTGRLLSWSRDKSLRVWDSHSRTCLTTLKGHTDSVKGALVLDDGLLLSWSDDKTLLLWDSQSGACIMTLQGHTGGVVGASELADGRVLSWSTDKTPRIWNGQNGVCTMELDGHTSDVVGALELRNGRLLTWSVDGSLRLWNGQTGACLAVLGGHTLWVYGAIELLDGRLLSWDGYGVLRLWDQGSGRCLAVLDHPQRVDRGDEDFFFYPYGIGAMQMKDGRLLSWSDDKTVDVWDSQTAARSAVLEGHSGGVNGALEMADGRILSWAADRSLRIWNSKTLDCPAKLVGHMDPVVGYLALADGRLLTWSRDKSLRLWNSETGECAAMLEGHTGWVNGALRLADGRILSWARDHTMRLWDSDKGACLGTINTLAAVAGTLALADGRALSWSRNYRRFDGWDTGEEFILRIWDLRTGACMAVLDGHEDEVNGALEMDSGRLLTWAKDSTLRVWNAQTGACVATLDGHKDEVSGVLELGDGRLLSLSLDNTLRLWDSQSGVCLGVLEGHTGRISGALQLTDRRLLSWSEDRTLRLWDGQSGASMEVVAQSQIGKRNAEWGWAIKKVVSPNNICLGFFAKGFARAAYLYNREISSVLAAWHGDSDVGARGLYADGTAVVTQVDGQVCTLKLHQGQRRIALVEAEALLPRLRSTAPVRFA